MISDRAIDRLREAAAWPELDARYAITGVAGRGGMGTVYVARDHVLDRDVAVKVLDVADQKGSRAARLQREAHILARLDHPGIVPVHDAGELPDGRTFYVMKLVKGRRLDDLVAQNASLADRLNAFGRVLDAVAFAHAHGVVHRDLKPENVMVGGFGEVYVMDWGVAQDGSADGEAAVVGTPGFMPPEQERPRAPVDARADIFALGALLAHLAGEAAPRRARGDCRESAPPGCQPALSRRGVAGSGPGEIPQPGSHRCLSRVDRRAGGAAVPAIRTARPAAARVYRDAVRAAGVARHLDAYRPSSRRRTLKQSARRDR